MNDSIVKVYVAGAFACVMALSLSVSSCILSSPVSVERFVVADSVEGAVVIVYDRACPALTESTQVKIAASGIVCVNSEAVVQLGTSSSFVEMREEFVDVRGTRMRVVGGDADAIASARKPCVVELVGLGIGPRGQVFRMIAVMRQTMNIDSCIQAGMKLLE